MYNSLETLPDNVRASLDRDTQKYWMSVYNDSIKKNAPHRNAVYRAWESVKATPSCRYFAGFVSTDRVDKQNDSVIVKGAYDKISKFIERGGFITDTHSNRLVGSFFHAELRKTNSGGEGVYAQGVIFRGEPYFDTTWTAIKKAVDCPTCHDVRKGTSIGGFALDTKVTCNGMQCHRDIIDLSIHEISVCADPANPDAVIDQINHFAKSDSVIPDGSDVMKKALVETQEVAPANGEMPMRSEDEMNAMAETGAEEAQAMASEGEEQQGGGLIEATDAAAQGNPEEGMMPTVEEIKAFKEKLKNVDKIIREISSIKESLMAVGGDDSGRAGVDAATGATEVAEGVVKKDYDEYGGRNPYWAENRDVHGKDKYINAPANAISNVAGLTGDMFTAAGSGNVIGAGMSAVKGQADKLQTAARNSSEASKQKEIDRRLKERNRLAEQRKTPPVTKTPPTAKAPTAGATTATKPSGLTTLGEDTEEERKAENATTASATNLTAAKQLANKVGVPSQAKQNTDKLRDIQAKKKGESTSGVQGTKVGKSCGCMDTEVHTPITEKKCPMKPLLYGDQIDPEKLKFLDAKDYEEKTNPVKKGEKGGMEGAVKLKDWKTAKEGPASEEKEDKTIGKSDMEAHIKDDMKEEQKIIDVAKKMKDEDKKELEKSAAIDCAKKFLAKYGPKNEERTVKEGGTSSIKNMGKEGKEVFMKSNDEFEENMEENVEETEEPEAEFEEENLDEGADELVEGVEDIVEEEEHEEIMTAKELISMVMQFLQENGVEVGAQSAPMDNPEIEGIIEKPESEIAFESYQDMADAECMGKMAMHKMQATFIENDMILSDDILTKGKHVDDWMDGITSKRKSHKFPKDTPEKSKGGKKKPGKMNYGKEKEREVAAFVGEDPEKVVGKSYEDGYKDAMEELKKRQ